MKCPNFDFAPSKLKNLSAIIYFLEERELDLKLWPDHDFREMCRKSLVLLDMHSPATMSMTVDVLNHKNVFSLFGIQQNTAVFDRTRENGEEKMQKKKQGLASRNQLSAYSRCILSRPGTVISDIRSRASWVASPGALCSVRHGAEIGDARFDIPPYPGAVLRIEAVNRK